MPRFKIWSLIYKASGFICFLSFFSNIFLSKKLIKFDSLIFIVTVFSLFLLIFSIFMNNSIKKKNALQTSQIKYDKKWKRFSIIQNLITLLLPINLLLYIFNNEYKKKFGIFLFPFHPEFYFFFFCIGLFLGFRICRNEINRVIGPTQSVNR